VVRQLESLRTPALNIVIHESPKKIRNFRGLSFWIDAREFHTHVDLSMYYHHMYIVSHEHVLTVRQDSSSNTPHIVHTPPPVSQRVLFTVTATWLRHYCDTKQKKSTLRQRLFWDTSDNPERCWLVTCWSRSCRWGVSVSLKWPLFPPGDVWLWRSAVELYWEGKTEELGEKSVLVLFVCKKTNVDWPGREPGPPRWETSD
jgi:hypothetical protein